MNYDELMIGMDPDFYRNLNERINDIDDSLCVLAAVAGAINTGKARSLDLSPESGIVRKILAGNNDPAPICLLRHIVFYKMAELTDAATDRLFLLLLAYYSFYPFDPHHAVMSMTLKKILEITPEQFPYRNVFVGELTKTLQFFPVYSKFDLPRLYFDVADRLDTLERSMESKYKVFLQQLRNMVHRNQQRIVFNTMQISRRDDYYPEHQYEYEYIPPEEFLSSYDRYRDLYFLDYAFGYDLTRDLDGTMKVLVEPEGMEFRVRYLPSKEDDDLASIIFHILDSVLSDVWGSHLVSIDNCFSFVFRTNTHNCFNQKMILSLAAALASSCPALKKVLSDGRLLLSERGHREFSLFIENTFPSVEGQMTII